MKVDIKQVMGPDWEPEMKDLPKPDKLKKPMKLMGVAALCLVLGAGVMVYDRMSTKDDAHADTLYKEADVNPVFTVQHVADVRIPVMEEGEGDVPVLIGDKSEGHAVLANGLLKTEKKRVTLYEDYETDWNRSGTLTAMSFLNGSGGAADGYNLEEMWIGKDKESAEASDFTILPVPQAEEGADFSKVSLTNNPDSSLLSTKKDGKYVPDKDGNYTICIENGDVIRLVFATAASSQSGQANVYDYDVSDGGYYVNDDYYRKGTKQPTSGQQTRQGNLYVDAVENGIHTKENYAGSGAKLAFGGESIGTPFGDAVREDELDTINVHNVTNTKTTGVALGLTSGITADGHIKWAGNIQTPALFGDGKAAGRTDYSDYQMTFTKKGFTRTLSSVQYKEDTVTKGLETVGKNFWIADKVPSYGTDGHDPVWGNGAKNVKYYRTGDRGSKRFAASDDRQNHNSFFGLSYTEDFTIPAGYTGPLDFFGYSDDDMWVYAAKIDKDGNAMEDTAVLVSDLGGVHEGTGSYRNLWELIKPIPYGKDAEHWRLFVFYLERDGASAKCYLRFTLPEAAILEDTQNADRVSIKAEHLKEDPDEKRTFMFDDGTNNRYMGRIDDKDSIAITAGKEFTVPAGSTVTVNGLETGKAFVVKETGKARIWSNKDGTYKESDTVSGTVGEEKQVTFVAVEHKGQIVIKAEGDGTPDKGYVFHVELGKVPDGGILAMDGANTPHGYIDTGRKGSFKAAIGANDALALYNVPEGTQFSVTAEGVDGYHVSKVLISDNLETSGLSVSGTADAQITYQYEKGSEKKAGTGPAITISQSVTGDWDTKDITLADGTPISYNITVKNPDNKTVECTIEDILPEGLSVMTSTLTDNAEVDGDTVKWNVKVDPKSSLSRSFTGTMSGKAGTEFRNQARVIIDGKQGAESNEVKAVIK